MDSFKILVPHIITFSKLNDSLKCIFMANNTDLCPKAGSCFLQMFGLASWEQHYVQQCWFIVTIIQDTIIQWQTCDIMGDFL